MSRLTYEESSLPAQARCDSTAKIEVVNVQKTVHSAHIILPVIGIVKVKEPQKKHEGCRVLTLQSSQRHRDGLEAAQIHRQPFFNAQSGWQQAIIVHGNSASSDAAGACSKTKQLFCCCQRIDISAAAPRAYKLG